MEDGAVQVGISICGVKLAREYTPLLCALPLCNACHLGDDTHLVRSQMVIRESNFVIRGRVSEAHNEMRGWVRLHVAIPRPFLGARIGCQIIRKDAEISVNALVHHVSCEKSKDPTGLGMQHDATQL